MIIVTQIKVQAHLIHLQKMTTNSQTLSVIGVEDLLVMEDAAVLDTAAAMYAIDQYRLLLRRLNRPHPKMTDL